ncbi:TPA: acyltransferase [Candidatus Daviesbacteria bacterium]|nr:acyltransferase [Candidatus Daviesbacteria bacterium]
MAILRDRMGKELSRGEAMSKVGNRFYNYLADFGLFWLHLLCYIPSHHVRRFLLRLAGAKIDQGSSFHMGCRFFSLKKIKIGEDSIIGYGAFLDGRDKIIIGNHVDIASDVMIYNSEHDINSDDFRAVVGAVEIEDYVFIGPRAIILPGVKISKGAVVGAGAVVTKDVADFTVVGGVPAEVIGERKLKDPHYKLGRARLFQ